MMAFEENCPACGRKAKRIRVDIEDEYILVSGRCAHAWKAGTLVMVRLDGTEVPLSRWRIEAGRESEAL